MKNVFSLDDINNVIARINNLTPSSERVWGKMDVAQMLAHLNVAYECMYEENKHPKPNFFMRFILKNFLKKIIVGEKPYKKNGQTAPIYLINSDKDFEAEKERLINFLKKTQELGESHFDNKESHSLGPLTKTEWNNMLYKHLDHHLAQFGV